MAATPDNASAQVPDGLSGIASLMQQLGQMQQRGSGLSLDSGRFTSPLDVSRGRSPQLMPTFGGGKGDPLVAASVREENIKKRLTLQIACSGVGVQAGELMRAAKAAGDISDVEADYCQRALQVVFQFGYDNTAPSDLGSLGGPSAGGFGMQNFGRAPISGAVQDDYRLGIGDELVITIIGAETRVVTVAVDTEGRAQIPQVRPIPAAGRTVAEFRRDVLAQLGLSMPRAEVFVSVGAIRAVRVTVVGEVNTPGLHNLTGLSSVLDALQMAGGVKKSGSLRRIRLERRNQISWIDLYDLLLSSSVGSEIQLNDGDRIIVPTLGSTIAVLGQVKRPGIYELAEGRRSTALGNVLEFAGGPIRPRGTRNIHVAFDPSGRQQIDESADNSATVNDGDIIQVVHHQNFQIGSVELIGHVASPGRRGMASAPSIRALIGDRNNLLPDPFLPFAALETVDEMTRSRRFVPVNLERILAGQEDIALKDADRLIVLSSEDVRFLSSAGVLRVLRSQQADGAKLGPDPAVAQRSSTAIPSDPPPATGQAPRISDPLLPFGTLGLLSPLASASAAGRPAQSQGGQTQSDGGASSGQRSSEGAALAALTRTCRGLEALASIMNSSRTERFYLASTGLGSEIERVGIGYRPCPAIFDANEFLLPFALEHVAVISGEVRQPGAYPVVSGTPLSSLAAVAGGLSSFADLTQVEISRSSTDPFSGTSQMGRQTHNLAQVAMQSIAAKPGDIVRFNAATSSRDSGPVLLVGEFVRPGLYDIRRGERLSALIQRVGGMTENAYPYGAIFTRESIRQSQKLALRRAARELNSAILFTAGQKGLNPAGFQQVSAMSQQLEEIEAIGRVVIEADLTVLQARPDLDIVLEPGDKLFMPKRPGFVMVVGDVLNPGAQQFVVGKRADSYISQAGGFQRSADEDRTFIVYPNGEAKPLKLSAWNYTPTQVPPGSTVIVPKEPAPFDLFTAIKDTTAIVGQIAVTAASLAVISRN
jgi:protein involved in polysaccharide export with SLBB domain